MKRFFLIDNSNSNYPDSNDSVIVDIKDDEQDDDESHYLSTLFEDRYPMHQMTELSLI